MALSLPISSDDTAPPEPTELKTDERCLESPKYTCSIGGALATVAHIHRAVPILHSGAGCGSSQMLSFRLGGGQQGIGYVGGMVTPSSNLSEVEVVFGGESKLQEQIKSTLDLVDGDLYVVIPGCIATIIGDDVQAVVRTFADAPYPVLGLDTSGYRGNTYSGYEAVFEAALDQLVTPLPKEQGLVNVLGFVPYQDVFWRGDLREVSSLLQKLGLRTNQVIGDFSGVEGLRQLSAAELTVVVSPWVGVNVAKKLESKFGVPFIALPNLPVGPAESTEFLRRVGAALGKAPAEVEAIIQAEERIAYADLDIAGDSCATFGSALPFAIIANSPTAVGLTRFLTNEAGFTPTLVVITDDPPAEARDAIRARLKGLGGGLDPQVAFEVDSDDMLQLLRKTDYRVLLGSSQERYEAQEQQKIFVSVSWPAHDRLVVCRSYSGYAGGIALLEDILSKFIMPY